MNHLSEEDLVLHYYGEAGPAAGAEEHLRSCERCRREFETISRTLEDCRGAFPVPEPGVDYEERVWRRLAGRLPKPNSRWAAWSWPRALAFAASMAGLLVAAFFLGRASVKPPQPISARASQRVLLVALGEHLERSQMVLAELVNSAPDEELPIDSERQRAADLVDENRLYRQTALKDGDRATADVLDDLERVLLAIARGPEKLEPGELEELQKRIQDQGILFRVRVLGSSVRRKGMSL